jgi:translin
MDFYSQLSELCHQDFEARHLAREEVLKHSRLITRHSAQAIRAVHRSETATADEELASCQMLLGKIKEYLKPFPDLYFSGYTQDALKEYVEARLTYCLILDLPLPLPVELGVEYSTYLRGMAETPGELRRRCLDILRKGYSNDAERLLTHMDEIYALLVTMDYPDAITYGLRHSTDQLRGIIERTRADVTISLREQHLQQALIDFEKKLPNQST